MDANTYSRSSVVMSEMEQRWECSGPTGNVERAG